MSFYSQFSHYYEEVFPFRSEVYSFLREHLAEAGQQVLDIGCGTGHYAQALAEAGFTATGIDLDVDMIETARRMFPECRFQIMDMSEISRLKRKFNLIFAIGNVVAHLPKGDLAKFLGEVMSCLEEGGFWIFQTVNWDFILTRKSYSFPVKLTETAGLKLFREYELLSSEKVMFKSCLKSEDDIFFADSVPLYPVTSADYIRFHREMGFKKVGHYADFRKIPYSTTADKANILVYQLI